MPAFINVAYTPFLIVLNDQVHMLCRPVSLKGVSPVPVITFRGIALARGAKQHGIAGFQKFIESMAQVGNEYLLVHILIGSLFIEQGVDHVGIEPADEIPYGIFLSFQRLRVIYR
jgi:hypothetical protein